MSEETYTLRMTLEERSRLLFALGCLAGRLYDGTNPTDHEHIMKTMELANRLGATRPDTEGMPTPRNIR
jgi:hypothetical protein